jgi:hypothetical protein
MTKYKPPTQTGPKTITDTINIPQRKPKASRALRTLQRAKKAESRGNPRRAATLRSRSKRQLNLSVGLPGGKVIKNRGSKPDKPTGNTKRADRLGRRRNARLTRRSQRVSLRATAARQSGNTKRADRLQRRSKRITGRMRVY